MLNMFVNDKSGRDCFIGSDMFYVEVSYHSVQSQ